MDPKNPCTFSESNGGGNRGDQVSLLQIVSPGDDRKELLS